LIKFCWTCDPLPETENPLNWWKLNSHHFPVLASFVKKNSTLRICNVCPMRTPV